MNKFVAAAMSAAVAAAPLVVAVSPAAADTPGCVTRAEYKAAHKGMGKKKVHSIFDTKGKQLSWASMGGYTSEMRSYKTCSRYSAVTVLYSNGKLDTKSAVWIN